MIEYDYVPNAIEPAKSRPPKVVPNSVRYPSALMCPLMCPPDVPEVITE
jgi:hypothetical protein